MEPVRGVVRGDRRRQITEGAAEAREVERPRPDVREKTHAEGLLRACVVRVEAIAQSSFTRMLIVAQAAWAWVGSIWKSGAPYFPSTRTIRNLLAAVSTLKEGSELMV